MASVKKILMAATALTMMSGVAYAQSNVILTDQIGTNNDISAEQGQATVGNAANYAGESGNELFQNGSNNQISIDQLNTGSSQNRIGTSGSVVGNQEGAGVEQVGNSNVLTIDQAGQNLRVWEVKQTSPASGSTTRNNATIEQGGNGHTVSNIQQNFSGSGAANSVFIEQSGNGTGYNLVGNTTSGARSNSGIIQTGTGNSASVDQDGSLNKIFLLRQTNSTGGGSNVAIVNQSGDRNGVREIKQTNTGGLDNTITMNMSGSSNGYVNYGNDTYSDDVFSSGSFASGIATNGNATVEQNGVGNDIGYSVDGSNNLYGFKQVGSGNIIGGTVSSGTRNEVAILQDGNDNIVDFFQSDFENNLGVEVDGNDNMLNIRQEGSAAAAGNDMLVHIEGNRNNNQSLGSPSLGSPASVFGALTVARGLVGNSFNQGDLFQDGENNEMVLNVTSDRNAFAMLQQGDGNTINGTIMGGVQNRAVVVQTSNNNRATFTQNGVSNNLGVVQGGNTTGNF